MKSKPKTLQEKVDTLITGEWTVDNVRSEEWFLSYPAFWNPQGRVWFGPFDPWVAEFILDAIKKKQARELGDQTTYD